MKKILIIVFAILILGGGTVGTLMALKLGPFSEDTEADAAAAAAEAASEPPKMINLEPLFIPVIRDENVAITFQVMLQLETQGTDSQRKLVHMLPRVSDAFLRDLYDYIPRRLQRGEEIDEGVLLDRLRKTGDRVAGAGLISKIRITSVTSRQPD